MILRAAAVSAAVSCGLLAQGYQVFLTGSGADVKRQTAPGLVLMGGGGDVDDAFRWMIGRSGGGDIVILRASGSDGYNKYIPALGAVDSVESFVIQDRAAASDARIVKAVGQAEALFIAGGDQWNYVRMWRDTPLAQAVNELARRAPVGGTSAGLAVLGEFVFAAENGSARSEDSLANPFDSRISLARAFLALPHMQGIIADSHFVERDRMGRTLAFLARIVRDGWAREGRAIAVDRATAVLVEPGGEALVAGKNVAYFVRAKTPAVCEPGRPLTLDGIEVVRLKRDQRFRLKTWEAGPGAAIYSLSVKEGKLTSGQPGGAVY